MEHTFSCKMAKIAETLNFRTLYKSTDYDTKLLTTSEVHRPGLQLDGFFTHFNPNRIQIIGGMEIEFMKPYSYHERIAKYSDLFARGIPCVVVTANREPGIEMLQIAEKYDVTVFSTDMETATAMTNIIRAVGLELAPRITRHGVLMEVYGLGVLIMGESGIGKSETAIELIKRGHRLVADDAVEIKRTDIDKLQGSAPDLIKYYVEVRGIGIIDVRRSFGMGAVKPWQDIALVVNFEPWKDGEVYDRLGLKDNYTNILGVDVTTYTVPVRPGRNLSVIIEVAAMEFRQKIMGFNAAKEFTEQINNHLMKGNS
ncbi:MAG: HPr(Ser) kinase/phosphatase [Oscillospiraceae bacterium]|nr:HPr(Ser) kinase/phosphatase [Oscillospiraceae bacterium]